MTESKTTPAPGSREPGATEGPNLFVHRESYEGFILVHDALRPVRPYGAAFAVAPNLPNVVNVRTRGPICLRDSDGTPLSFARYSLVSGDKATLGVTDREGWVEDHGGPLQGLLFVGNRGYGLQGALAMNGPGVVAPPPPPADPLIAPLSSHEWHLVDEWMALGEVGIEPLTDDADHNAAVVASAIFCGRAGSYLLLSKTEDPLLCIDPGVTQADRRVKALKTEVTKRGPIVNWSAVSADRRMVYVMDLLVDTYHYAVNGAAGIVGNLYAESGVLPNRIEGSAGATPLRAPDFSNKATDFTPDEVMNRSSSAHTGPKLPGIGLAQWTSGNRRTQLFQQIQNGRSLGSSVLVNMDAQVAYLVGELQANAGLNARLSSAGISANDASDDIVYLFEIPGSLLDAQKHKLPRSAAPVQAVFHVRRALSQNALRAYQAVQAARASTPAATTP